MMPVCTRKSLLPNEDKKSGQMNKRRKGLKEEMNE